MMKAEYVDAEDLIQPDTRGPVDRWLHEEMERRGAGEQGAESYPFLEAIARDLFTEATALRATEQQLREELAAIRKAVQTLTKARGRYNTEQAYKALEALARGQK